MRDLRILKSSSFRSLLVAAGLFAAVLFASTSTADARVVRSHPGDRHVAVRSHIATRGHVFPRNFVAPRHVNFRAVHTFDPFFSRRVFFAPHRHFHSVFTFPVYTSYGVVYRPYTYCGNDLYYGGGYDGCDGYYDGCGGYYDGCARPHGYVRFRGPHVGVALGF